MHRYCIYKAAQKKKKKKALPSNRWCYSDTFLFFPISFLFPQHRTHFFFFFLFHVFVFKGVRARLFLLYQRESHSSDIFYLSFYFLFYIKKRGRSKTEGWIVYEEKESILVIEP